MSEQLVTLFQSAPDDVDQWVIEWSADGQTWEVVASSSDIQSPGCWEIELTAPGSGYIQGSAHNPDGWTDYPDMATVPEAGLGLGLAMGVLLIVAAWTR